MFIQTCRFARLSFHCFGCVVELVRFGSTKRVPVLSDAPVPVFGSGSESVPVPGHVINSASGDTWSQLWKG